MKALSAMKSCEYMMPIAKFQYIADISCMRKKYSRILGVISKKALTYSLVLIDILVKTENRQIPENKKKKCQLLFLAVDIWNVPYITWDVF